MSHWSYRLATSATMFSMSPKSSLTSNFKPAYQAFQAGQTFFFLKGGETRFGTDLHTPYPSEPGLLGSRNPPRCVSQRPPVPVSVKVLWNLTDTNIEYPYIDPYIYDNSEDPVNPQIRCSACNSRTLADYQSHIAKPSHHQAAADEALLYANRSSSKSPMHQVDQEVLDQQTPLPDDSPVPNSPDRPLTPLSYLRDLQCAGLMDDASDSDQSDHVLDLPMLRKALEAMDNLLELNKEEEFQDHLDLDAQLDVVHQVESNGWYPFTKKEVVALLIIGSTRSLLSQLQYHRIRSILRICDVALPAWGSLRDLSKRLKKKMGLDIAARESPTGNPLFGLKVQKIVESELANPIVSQHLVWIPELPGEDPINRLSQCRKWRELYPPHLRVQMVEMRSNHYYIYKPVQLIQGQLVVPMFFYPQGDDIMGKCVPAVVEPDGLFHSSFNIFMEEEHAFDSPEFLCINVKTFWRTFNDVKLEYGLHLSNACGNHMYLDMKDIIRLERTTSGVELIPLVNPWRIKAQGKIIRHVPLTLYSDDTSGNVSKKFNKHMSIYFTLSGLPPVWSNQEYNTHFLATTNCASAPELFDKVVDDINVLGRDGFTAYDHLLGQEVMAMVVVLCHLGDSPMHAEICNTKNPANTLTPCRMCDLHALRQVDKQSEGFVRDFVGIDLSGYKECLHLAHDTLLQKELPLRDWFVTCKRTREIWHAAQNRNSKKLVDDLGRKYGLQDTLNEHFIQMVQAGFNGHLDTPVEILHVILLGVVKYLYRDTMKTIKPGKPSARKYHDLSARWRSFNRKGLNMPPIQPNTLLQFFQSLVGKEFRTVLQTVPFVIYDLVTDEMRHLWASLCQLGSYVFQTEISNVEIYLKDLDNLINRFLNQLISVTAQWANKPKFHMLIHIKYSIRRFGPPCLVATEKFESFNGKTRDALVHSNKQSPGNDIANTFLTAMMRRLLLSGTSYFDHQLQARVAAGHEIQGLMTKIPELSQAMGLDMNLGHRNVYSDGGPKSAQGTFPACLETAAPNVPMEEFSNAMEELAVSSPFGSLIRLPHLDRFSSSVGPPKGKLCHSMHNCHGGECTTVLTHPRKIERTATKMTVPTVKHSSTPSFILNSASHYSAELHRKLADLHVDVITLTQWNTAVATGVAKWKATPRPTRQNRRTTQVPDSP
ncbi:hypothetical protein DFH28DRAFT_931583 [Melampsora americana]|nr:hypothetical protein DFH28DRAFT_931583 [Melampsora americana]